MVQAPKPTNKDTQAVDHLSGFSAHKYGAPYSITHLQSIFHAAKTAAMEEDFNLFGTDTEKAELEKVRPAIATVTSMINGEMMPIFRAVQQKTIQTINDTLAKPENSAIPRVLIHYEVVKARKRKIATEKAAQKRARIISMITEGLALDDAEKRVDEVLGAVVQLMKDAGDVTYQSDE